MTTVSELTDVPYSGNYRIDSLLGNLGANWNYLLPAQSTLCYTFDCSPGSVVDQGTSEALTAFNGAQRAAAASILSYASSVTGIRFVETASGSTADFHFGATDIAGSTASGLTSSHSNYTYNSGQVVVSYTAESYIYLDNVEFAGSNTTPSAGSQGYETLLHEIGHALGLRHPFDGAVRLPAAEDNTNNTVMSYTESGGNKSTFQAYDLLALAWIYGNDGLGGQYGYNSSLGPSLSLGGASDTTAPTVANFSPADEASGIAAGSDIVVTFSEAVQRGAGNIVLKNAGGAIIATYDAATSGNLSISGSTLTINPTADLSNGTAYKVEFAAGSIKDIAGNSYAGTTTYNFTTDAIPTTGKTLVGTSGNDTLIGTLGSDTFEGGNGTDTAVFAGNLANHVVAKTASSYTVSSIADGTDTLSNVEHLQFSDTTVAFDSAGDAGQAYRLYQAAFNRAPDKDGLAYWINNMDNGATLDAVSSAFVSSSEFNTLYGSNPTNGQLITAFYQNVLHRAADEGGYNFWVNVLDLKKSTVAQVLTGFSESAENKAQLASVIDNGIKYVSAANDKLVGSISNDIFDGGAGIDTAMFNSAYAGHTLTKTATGWTVGSTVDGNDTLTNVERLQFSDKSIALDINGDGGQAYRLYQAAFNRSPDKDGLGYWIKQMDNGEAINDVSAQFLASAESTALYGANPTTAAFVNSLYLNALHRTADEGGRNYWIDQIDSGAITRAQALTGFSESAENQAQVIGIIQNGFEYTLHVA